MVFTRRPLRSQNIRRYSPHHYYRSENVVFSSLMFAIMQKETNLNEFEKKIGITFKNKDLLLQAFTHRSYLNEHPESKIRDNERLEFLGDAVLELATTTFLYDRFTDKAEGELTGLRAALVNTRQLATCARELKLN